MAKLLGTPAHAIHVTGSEYIQCAGRVSVIIQLSFTKAEDSRIISLPHVKYTIRLYPAVK